MTTPTPFPKIDYTSKDYASLRQSMLDNIADPTGSAAGSFADWTAAADPSSNDFGVALIEAFAYMGDILSWYNDRVALEAYLDTASLRSSVLSIAALLDYVPISAQPSQVTVIFTVVPGSGTIVIPAGTNLSTVSDGITPVQNFQTDVILAIEQDDDIMQTGMVTATQGATISNEDAGNSDGTPSQTYLLANSGVLSGSLKVYVDEGQGALLWTEIDHLIDASAQDYVYTTAVDSLGQTSLSFGDGVTGKIPVAGATVTLDYRTGGGLVGNVGVGTITELVDYIDGVVPPDPAIGFNPVAATGGSDAESTESIRRNAPKALTTLARCVTLADHANVILGLPRVAKAAAAGISYTNVMLYVCDVNGVLSPDLTILVQDYIADKLMAGGSVTVLPPAFVPFVVTAAIEVGSRFVQSSVIAASVAAVTTAYSISNVDFAEPVRASDIYAILLAVPGVIGVTVSVLTPTANPVSELGVASVGGQIAIIENEGVTITATGGITS